MIRIRGYDVEVDIANEIQKYDWNSIRWAGEKFLACSPFRGERHPSFAVNLETGTWIDSGSDSDEWKKGNFVKLLAWLRNETYHEAEDYLLNEYASIDIGDVDSLSLNFALLSMGEEKSNPLDKSVLREYAWRHPYLEQERGIEELYQRGFSIGYDRKARAVTFPWFDRNGNLANVKFRSVTSKIFWYYKGGQPIKNHIFGLNHVHRKKERRAFVVESEIDALTLWQAGHAAIALGGANMTPKQRELLLQSPIEELVIATDNDKAGRKIRDSIVRQLNGFMVMKEIVIPEHAKDVNELTRKELLRVCNNAIDIRLQLVS